MNAPDPKANTTTEAYLAYKAGYLEESELKPKLYEPYLHFDAWLAYWSGLTNDYPNKGPGKNLWGGYSDYTRTNQSVEFYTYSNGSITAKGIASATAYSVVGSAIISNNVYITLSVGDYYLSTYKPLPEGVTIQVINEAGSILKSGEGSFTLTGTSTVACRLSVASGTDINNGITVIPMISSGTTATDYEPYSPIPEMLTDEEALVAYLSGVTNTYPEEIKDPYDVRIVGYLKHLASIRWPEPDYPVNNEEFYLSNMEPTHTSNPEPSSDIELDTVDGKIISVEAYGDTFQQTYTGKNLIDNTDLDYDYTNANTGDITLTSTATGISMTYTGGGSAPFVLFVLQDLTGYEGKTIRMSSTFNGDLIRIYTSNADGTSRNAEVHTSTSGEVISWTVPNDLGDNHYLAYGLRGGPAGTYTFDDLIMTIDNADMSYEPYTGGISAPNPDYPQDVNVVTGEQTVTVRSKNLFNKDATPNYMYGTSCSAIDTGVRITRTSTTINTAYTRFVFNVENYIGQTITLSANASVSAINVPRINMGTCDSNGGNRVEKDSQQGTGTLTVSYTIEAGDQYIFINFYANYLSQNVQVGDYADYENAQLEIGSTPTDYQPYQSQSYTVNLGSTELCKIGDYQDYIYKSGDDWYVHKKIGKNVFDGTESWSSVNSVAYFITEISADIVRPSDIYSLPLVLSPDFGAVTRSRMYNSVVNYGIGIHENTPSRIIIRNKDCANTSAFTTWLGTNNVTCYYALTTPTDTKITDSTLIGQLEALSDADTYNEKTIIQVTATSSNLPALLKVEAYKY